MFLYVECEREGRELLSWCVGEREREEEGEYHLSLCTLHRSAVKSCQEFTILKWWCNVGFGEERETLERIRLQNPPWEALLAIFGLVLLPIFHIVIMIVVDEALPVMSVFIFTLFMIMQNMTFKDYYFHFFVYVLVNLSYVCNLTWKIQSRRRRKDAN